MWLFTVITLKFSFYILLDLAVVSASHLSWLNQVINQGIRNLVEAELLSLEIHSLAASLALYSCI